MMTIAAMQPARSAYMSVASLCLMTLLAHAAPAAGAEVRVVAGGPLASSFKEIGPQFERATGHKLIARVAATAVAKREIDEGATFDVAISATPAIDEWIKAGKIVAATRTTIVRSGLGVVVRAGAPRPQMGSVDELKRALLNAKSLAHNAQSASADDFGRIVATLQIAEEMKPKLRPIRSGTVPNAVLNGEAEIGIATIPTIVATSGVELAGPLPAELQTYVSFSAGVGTGAKEPEAGRQFIQFLATPAARAIMTAKGLEAGSPE